MSRTTHRSLAFLLLASTALPLALPAPALAQAPQGAQEPGLEEIVVSARRRDENLREVPISVSAISGEALEKQGTQDIVSLAQSVPNLTLEVSRGTNTTLTAFIRGVGQQDPVAGFEAGVGLYVDDVYLNRPQAAVLDVYEVERVEVLRGPQGTLYGRNTIGGAIKYVTRPLADEPTFKLRTSVGTDQMFDLVLTGSLPITDKAKIGASVARLSRDGFGENLTIQGLDNYDKDVWAARGTIELAPTETFMMRFSGDWVKDNSAPRQGHRLITSRLTNSPVLDNVFDTRAGLNNPEQEVEAWGVTFRAELKLSDTITLKNILAYRKDESFSPIDFDSLPAVDVDVPVVYRNKQLSEEFQIAYEGDKLKGIAGFYYLDANAFNAFDVILGTTGALLNLPGFNSFTLGDVDTETWSLFADLTYDISDQFSVALGGRYTSDKRTSQILRQTLIGGTSRFFGGNPTVLSTTSNFTGSETFKDFTPRASVSWKPTDEHTVYFTYSKGFKGGGFDPRGQSTAAPDTNRNGVRDPQEIKDFLSFDPETVDSFELGWKASLFENRLNFALAGFLGKYKDVQIPGSVGVDNNGDGINESFIGITSNAASADINGVELEGQALLASDLSGRSDRLILGFALGYIDAQYNEFIDAFGRDVASQRVFQNTPKWTGNLSLTYSTPLTLFGNDGEFSWLTSLAYRSKASQFEAANPFLDQSKFALWDMSFVWGSDDGRWQVGLHGKNLTDKEYKVAGYNFMTIAANGTLTPNLGREGTLTAFYGNPRQVYVSLGLNF